MIDSNDTHSKDQGANAPPLSDLDRLRRQARQRFIGSAVLVLIALIAFPFLLDSQPRPVAANITIDIPRLEAPPAPVVPPSSPSSSPIPEISAPEIDKVNPPAPAATTPTKTEDGTRDQSSLNGQTPVQGYIVQAGSYSEASKLHDVQTRLDKAGLKHYTQTVHSKDGILYTRVRLGPFDTQKEANVASARIAKLGIKAIVLKP